MKYIELEKVLNDHNEKQLRFEYEVGKYVNPNFHITEVKNAKINAVDCGGRMDSWNETILQLWNPKSIEERYPMKGKKALSILSIVDKMSPIDRESEVYFEYGNDTLRVSNYAIDHISIQKDTLTIHFEGLSTQCKPQSENESACCSTDTVNIKFESEAAPRGCC